MCTFSHIYEDLRLMEDYIVKYTDETHEDMYNTVLETLYNYSESIMRDVIKIIERSIGSNVKMERGVYSIYAKYMEENTEIIPLHTIEELMKLEENGELPGDIVYNYPNNSFLAYMYALKLSFDYIQYNCANEYEKEKQKLLAFCKKTKIDKYGMSRINDKLKRTEESIVSDALAKSEDIKDSSGFIIEDQENILEICERYAPNHTEVLKLKNYILEYKLSASGEE